MIKKEYSDLQQTRNVDPAMEEMVRNFHENLPGKGLEICDIVEARRIMELSMVEIVIERVEEEDILELSSLLEQMGACLEAGDQFAELDGRFHTRLMGCGRNEVLTLFIGTLNNVIDREVLKNDLNIRRNAQVEHGNILAALRQRDARRLKEAMNAHLLCFKKLYF